MNQLDDRFASARRDLNQKVHSPARTFEPRRRVGPRVAIAMCGILAVAGGIVAVKQAAAPTAPTLAQGDPTRDPTRDPTGVLAQLPSLQCTFAEPAFTLIVSSEGVLISDPETLQFVRATPNSAIGSIDTTLELIVPLPVGEATATGARSVAESTLVIEKGSGLGDGATTFEYSHQIVIDHLAGRVNNVTTGCTQFAPGSVPRPVTTNADTDALALRTQPNAAAPMIDRAGYGEFVFINTKPQSTGEWVEVSTSQYPPESAPDGKVQVVTGWVIDSTVGPPVIATNEPVTEWTFVNPTAGMEPLADVGTTWIVRTPVSSLKRGDLVVVELVRGEAPVMKRIIGLPGEQVIPGPTEPLIDGKPLTEPYRVDNSKIQQDFATNTLVNLGADQYYVMGDQRFASRDSRSVGAISVSQIVAKVVGPLGDETGLRALPVSKKQVKQVDASPNVPAITQSLPPLPFEPTTTTAP
jgi:signal peptidase I